MKQFVSGTMGRIEYTIGVIGVIIGAGAIFVFSNLTHGSYLVLCLLLLLLLFIVDCAITARRLRSIGIEGFYAFLLVVPFVNVIMQLMLIFWRPKPNTGNRSFFITLIAITAGLTILFGLYIFALGVTELPGYLERNHVN